MLLILSKKPLFLDILCAVIILALIIMKASVFNSLTEVKSRKFDRAEYSFNFIPPYSSPQSGLSWRSGFGTTCFVKSEGVQTTHKRHWAVILCFPKPVIGKVALSVVGLMLLSALQMYRSIIFWLIFDFGHSIGNIPKPFSVIRNAIVNRKFDFSQETFLYQLREIPVA